MMFRAHEAMATNARRRLNKLVGPDVHGSQRPAFKVALILDALYHYAATADPERGDPANAARLYEDLTGEQPGWLDRSVPPERP